MRARQRLGALVLLGCVAACASPATTPRDTPAADAEPPPRFAAGGPDAEEFGAGLGYPQGDRTTFFRIGWLIGSHSHLDEIFPSRLVHKAPGPSRLVRVAEPPITWQYQGLDLTLDDYLARTPTTGLLIARRHHPRRALPVRPHGPRSLHVAGCSRSWGCAGSGSTSTRRTSWSW